jgi:hypothetical protein
LAAVEDPGQVHVEHEAPVLWRHLDQGCDLGDARVVDDDVQAAKLADRALDQRLDLGIARDVGGRDERPAPPRCGEVRRLLERRLRSRGERHVGAGLGQRHRDRPTEAAAGPGDHRDLAGEEARRRGQR